MEKVMEVYPRHKQLVDAFVEKGKIMGIGTFTNPAEGSMGIFINRDSAEEFIRLDPFVKEGVVGKKTVKEWNDRML